MWSAAWYVEVPWGYKLMISGNNIQVSFVSFPPSTSHHSPKQFPLPLPHIFTETTTQLADPMLSIAIDGFISFVFILKLYQHLQSINRSRWRLFVSFGMLRIMVGWCL